MSASFVRKMFGQGLRINGDGSVPLQPILEDGSLDAGPNNVYPDGLKIEIETGRQGIR